MSVNPWSGSDTENQSESCPPVYTYFVCQCSRQSYRVSKQGIQKFCFQKLMMSSSFTDVATRQRLNWSLERDIRTVCQTGRLLIMGPWKWLICVGKESVHRLPMQDISDEKLIDKLLVSVCSKLWSGRGEIYRRKGLTWNTLSYDLASFSLRFSSLAALSTFLCFSASTRFWLRTCSRQNVINCGAFDHHAMFTGHNSPHDTAAYVLRMICMRKNGTCTTISLRCTAWVPPQEIVLGLELQIWPCSFFCCIARSTLQNLGKLHMSSCTLISIVRDTKLSTAALLHERYTPCYWAQPYMTPSWSTDDMIIGVRLKDFDCRPLSHRHLSLQQDLGTTLAWSCSIYSQLHYSLKLPWCAWPVSSHENWPAQVRIF